MGTLPHCPPPKRQQGSGRAAVAVLAATRAEGAWRASHAVPSMAIPSGPCCQIRALVMHVYPVALGLLRSSWHQGVWP